MKTEDRIAKVKREKWEIYEGGNFVLVTLPGFEDYVDQNHYLGGPLRLCEINRSVTDEGSKYGYTHEDSMKVAAIIVNRVNKHDQLVKAVKLAIEFARSPNDQDQKHVIKTLKAALK